ncbi:glycosyltransferase family 2 protein [bacterium SCSIO 12643]|nr:glycosyltransferase family 2 protein [bacterium SCSIO 12643]
MVSVLIPVYGESIDAQLASLAIEAKTLDYAVEIIVCDDASPQPRPPAFTNYKGIEYRFIQLDENLGRSRIRNFLAHEAKYDQLIFIDADCQPIQSRFIDTYKVKFEEDTVLVGGQLFATEPPSSLDKMLRWNYGTNVEARSLKDRKKSPYRSFMANNFSISKKMIFQYPFDEAHTGYGHEDTLFGLQLKNNDVKVVHIKNPIRHLCNETNQEFLEKTTEGVKNLAQLYYQGKLDRHVRLIKIYEKLKKTGFVRLTRALMYKRQRGYYQDLLKGNAKLRKFSLYKLGEFMLELDRLKETVAQD